MAEEIKSENTEKKQIPNRIPDEKGRMIFPPGVSGNPSGKPPGTYSIVTALKRRLAEIIRKDGRQAGDDYLDLWLQKARKEKGFEALREIIHQIDGKPKQPLAVSGDKENPLILQVINYGAAKENNDTPPVSTETIPTGATDKPGEVQDRSVAQEIGEKQDGPEPANNKNPA